MNRRKKVITRLMSICFFLLLSAGHAGVLSYWQQSVLYRMEVSLDPENHLLTGESVITYKNNSPDTLDRIYMHLYPNAFQEGSVKHREFQHQHYPGGISSDNPSYIEIKSLKITGKGISSSTFKVEDTILSAFLPAALVPDDSITIKLSWDHKVRERMGRMGYLENQYDFAQWYPKLVVYDESGWHNIPFHAIGEFYGEFGQYHVTIDVPGEYIVGATGVVAEGNPGWESVMVDTIPPFSDWLTSLEETDKDTLTRRTVTFHAENVHDFAWITSPTFVYEHGVWGGIDVHVLFNTSVGEKWTKVVRERSERALEWLTDKVGPYPYPQVTVTHAMRGGGMEYPMLVMNGNESEGLILHEIGHIWFYGILANNEVNEPWLDEGFATFQTRSYLENRYPPYGIDFKSSNRYRKYQQSYWKFNSMSEREQWKSIGFIISGFNKPIATKSYLSTDYSTYRQNAYTKPSLMLQSLQYMLGEEVFTNAMNVYYQRWKFKHINKKRFQNVFEEVSGEDLDWFFDLWLHTTFYNDYAIRKWKWKRLENEDYEVSLTIVNKGDMFFPLDIDVLLSDGEKFRTHWSNHSWRWEDNFTFTVPGKPNKIILDPDNKTLDVNLLNNQSGFPRYQIYFNWPGLDYKPRDAYSLTWNPIFWYHETDGFKPGISIVRAYEHKDRLALSFTAGTKSGEIHGKLQYRRSLWFLLPSLELSLHGYHLEGVQGTGADLYTHWNEHYNIPPEHNLNFGFYVTSADNSGYTDLYEFGIITLFYGRYRISANVHNLSTNFTFDISSVPDGMSDWSFGRLISQLELSGNMSDFQVSARLIGGYMQSGKGGVPAQEKFTVHGAGSGDYFSKPYLRHPSSFYQLKIKNDDFVRNHFHLYGDANLRGYYQHGFAGAENLLTGSIEVSRPVPVPVFDLTVRTFFDGGWLWSESDKLEGDLLMDSGFGFAVQRTVFETNLKLRIDFPVWLNYQNNPGENEIGQVDLSRWVIGFDVGL